MPKLINLELSLFNNTADNIEAKLIENFNSALLKKADDYELCISRFRLPLTTAPIHKITDTTGYEITLESNTLHLATSGGYEQSGSSTLQLTSLNPIYSPTDFKEYVNRCLWRSHRELISNFSAFIDEVTNTKVFAHNSTDQTMAISLTGATETYNVKLTLDNYSLESAVGGEIPLINVDLVSPSGTICRVASSVLLSENTSYEFTNGGVVAYDAAVSENTINIDGELTISPKETFLKFKDDAADGNWIVRVSPAGAHSLEVSIRCTLEVCAPPTSAGRFQYPSQPPVVTLTDNYFSWNIPERFIHSGMRIKLGDKLKQILTLNKYAISNYIELPITSISTDIDQIKTFKQEAKKIFMLNQLEKVLIVSNSLPVQRDYTNNEVPSSAIASFILPSDELEEFTEVSYVTDASIKPWRRYRLLTQTELSNFDISAILKYKDGSEEKLYLEPSQSMNVLLSFFEVS